MHGKSMCPISCADVCIEKATNLVLHRHTTFNFIKKNNSTKNSARSFHRLIKMTRNKERERIVQNSGFQVMGLIGGRAGVFSSIFSANLSVGHVT